MLIQGREQASFSDRVWKEIQGAVDAVKQTCTTARRLLEVDGPWGAGLTSVSGDDRWLEPGTEGPISTDWGVAAGAQVGPAGDAELIGRRGTTLVYAPTRPVPLITSEFVLGVRNIEGFDDDCQPLDLSRAAQAARDVALEEERLIFYGNPRTRQPGLLTINRYRHILRQLVLADTDTFSDVDPEELEQAHTDLNDAGFRGYARRDPALTRRLLDESRHPVTEIALPQTIGATGMIDVSPVVRSVQDALNALSNRGFAGPYALALYPGGYNWLLTEFFGEHRAFDVLYKLFEKGIYSVPAIQLPPAQAGVRPRLGVIVTCNRTYVRLVVGQDWVVSYRGRTGGSVFHRFAISSSLRVEIAEPAALQVLVGPPA